MEISSNKSNLDLLLDVATELSNAERGFLNQPGLANKISIFNNRYRRRLKNISVYEIADELLREALNKGLLVVNYNDGILSGYGASNEVKGDLDLTVKVKEKIVKLINQISS